jgi:hypothetical protein
MAKGKRAGGDGGNSIVARKQWLAQMAWRRQRRIWRRRTYGINNPAAIQHQRKTARLMAKQAWHRGINGYRKRGEMATPLAPHGGIGMLRET